MYFFIIIIDAFTNRLHRILFEYYREYNNFLAIFISSKLERVIRRKYKVSRVLKLMSIIVVLIIKKLKWPLNY